MRSLTLQEMGFLCMLKIISSHAWKSGDTCLPHLGQACLVHGWGNVCHAF